MSKLTQPSRPALVIAAAGAALAGALAVTGTASAAPGAAFSAWPMFHADPGHSGLSPETAISTMTAPSLTTRWTARLGTPSYTSPAVAASGGRALVYAGAGNHFSAYPAGGGAAVWSYTLPAGVVENSPAVVGGVVYFGSTAGTVFALNASTGGRICSFNTGQAILASPVVVGASDGSGPVVYDGTVPNSGSGAEYAIYGPGNRHGACTMDWKFNSWAVTPGGTWSSPAYGMGAGGVPLLVFGSKDRDDSVYALNARTGARVWRYQTSTLADSDVGAPPTISPRGRNGFTDGVVYATGKDKAVYALNLATGSLIWKHALATGTNGDLSGAALVGDRIYVGIRYWCLRAQRHQPGHRSGTSLPRPLSSVLPRSPGRSGGRCSWPGAPREAFTHSTWPPGATLWTQKPDNSGFWGSPAVSQGGFYIAGLDGVLRDFAPRS